MGCVPWVDRYMLRAPHNEKRRPMPVAAFPKKGVDAGDALPTVYITNRPEGNLTLIVRASDCASSGGLSPRVAADPKAANAEKEGPQES